MKLSFRLAFAATCFCTTLPRLTLAADPPASPVYETSNEFFGTGDFDGDGRLDLVLVDKASGKYRLGYQLPSGQYSWVDNRPSGIKGLTGFGLGKLLTTNQDTLIFTSADANQLTILDVSSPTAPAKPVVVPFDAGLGPNTVIAAPADGDSKTKLDGLYVSSIYNSPDPSQAVLLQNTGGEFTKTAEEILPAPARRGTRVALKAGGPNSLSVLIQRDKGDEFRIEAATDGKLSPVADVADLPSGSEYTTGHFRKSPLPDFIFFKPGDSKMTSRPIEEPSANHFELGKGNVFDLGQPVLRVIDLGESGGRKLLVIFGEGEQAGIFSFDGASQPLLKQTIIATNELLTWATASQDGILAFSRPTNGKFSTRYYSYDAGPSGYAFKVFGSLPSLAENDNITIPDIYQRISTNLAIKTESEMKLYTNQIPGTPVSYAMVPIHGGEFLMGSPNSEKGRKPDEGPQHKVKISPFWMGQCEVTWNEYELFMYPDEEKRIRATMATNSAGDDIADAITHPSKPYVEMSFGMGKDGFPAISMTQHAANKYCQWLSAKTGEFYRLPTEAEWEYACRAGTTTPYFFGKDVKKLGDYAWYEQNSDFKYQKVGKKKPNPWGLYDMYGNVTEWVLDQYDPDFYKKSAAQGPSLDPWNRASQPYPHSVRGGSWDDEANLCRSAARRGSDRAWKMTDPQLPKSVWYFSDAQFVGFRIVRPLKLPPPGDLQKCWTSGVERD